MSATIRDVAKRAGVSIATVSYVINGTRTLSKETTEQVQQAIRECGYVPNVAAKSLKIGKSRIVGVITPSCHSSYFSGVFEGFEEEMSKAGYHVIIAGSNLNTAVERQMIDTLSGGIVDGLLLFSLLNRSSEMRNNLPETLPCVLADFHTDKGMVPADTIVHTFDSAIREAVRDLHRHGHDRISICLGIKSLTSVRVQMQIFREALEEEGLEYRDDLVLHFTHRSNTRDMIKKAMQKGCHAFCFINSNIMRRAFYTEETNEFVLPSDCDFVYGYEFSEDMLLNGIPRIIVPTVEIGRKAAEMLLERMQEGSEKKPYRSIRIPCTFQK